MKKAYLVLGNGRVFEGQSIGAEGNTLGEMVFTTGVVGYQETLTDPNYAGQIVMQTFPLIGNYGVIEEDIAGKCTVSGYVVREICNEPSNFRSDYALDKLLKDNGVCGICGVDTRELTRILRDEGTMNAMICTEPPADLAAINAYKIENAAVKACCSEKYTVKCENRKFRVAVLDLGNTKNIIKELSARGCELDVLPFNTKSGDILAGGYDGIVLSEGPGDPAQLSETANDIKGIVGKLPVLGIGLGHQLVAMAIGGSTFKLKYGHRGGNQPVRDIKRGRTLITTQNHGYAVDPESVPAAYISYVNANDGSCEGLAGLDKQLLTLQFMPEHISGIRDANCVIDEFVEMMGGTADAQR